MKKINSILVILFLSLVSHFNVVAQCKSIVKEGIQKLTPYTHNGQVNNVILREGKTAELHLSFYKGLNYKLQISADQELGKVNFRVLDENKKEVYNSTTAEKPADFWSFYSNSSQELIIELTSSEPKKGCAAVLVGMQIPKNNNPIRNL